VGVDGLSLECATRTWTWKITTVLVRSSDIVYYDSHFDGSNSSSGNRSKNEHYCTGRIIKNSKKTTCVTTNQYCRPEEEIKVVERGTVDRTTCGVDVDDDERRHDGEEIEIEEKEEGGDVNEDNKDEDEEKGLDGEGHKVSEVGVDVTINRNKNDHVEEGEAEGQDGEEHDGDEERVVVKKDEDEEEGPS